MLVSQGRCQRVVVCCKFIRVCVPTHHRGTPIVGLCSTCPLLSVATPTGCLRNDAPSPPLHLLSLQPA
jgi:hypothetical protein